MEIIIGTYSGFCQGIKNTYNQAKKELIKGKTYCLGELIHNKQVLKELEDLNMVIVDNIKEVPDGSRLIFRAHGEPPSSYNYAKKHNIEIIDLTCGRVKAIHNKVLKKIKDSFIIIIGKKEHPEIIGTKGFSNKFSIVIEDERDIKDAYQKYIDSNKKNIYIVSQTTFSSIKFDKLINIIKEKFKNINIKVDKTICDATEKRQKETIELSKKCTKVLVVGSKNSSNTKELYNIAASNCKSTFFIETIIDVLNIDFSKDDIVAVVAGASVPKELIDLVVKKIER